MRFADLISFFHLYLCYALVTINEISSNRINYSIAFDIDINYLDSIINRKIKKSNYILMNGIIYALLKLKGKSSFDAKDISETILYQNNFLTLIERNRKIHDNIKTLSDNNSLKLYDYLPNEFEKEYAKIYDDIKGHFSFIRDMDIEYAVKNLKKFSKNCDSDFGFMFAILSLPFHKLNVLDFDRKKEFLMEENKLIEKYISKSDNTVKND